MRLIVFATALDSRGASYYNRRMSNANSNAAVTALDSDGEEFTLDFGFPAVATRPVVTREGRSAEFRASWHEEHNTAAKPRG